MPKLNPSEVVMGLTEKEDKKQTKQECSIMFCVMIVQHSYFLSCTDICNLNGKFGINCKGGWTLGSEQLFNSKFPVHCTCTEKKAVFIIADKLLVHNKASLFRNKLRFLTSSKEVPLHTN